MRIAPLLVSIVAVLYSADKLKAQNLAPDKKSELRQRVKEDFKSGIREGKSLLEYLQIKMGITDKEVRIYLHEQIQKFVERDWKKMTRTEMNLACYHIGMLKSYGNKDSIPVLKTVLMNTSQEKPLEESPPMLRLKAIFVHLYITDYRMSKTVEKIFKEQDGYTHIDASEAWSAFKNGGKGLGAINEKLKKLRKKKHRILTTVEKKVLPIVASRHVFVHIDQFMVENKKGYATSELRHRMLKKFNPEKIRHLTTPDGKKKKRWEDVYVRKQLKEFKNKKSPE